MPFYDFTCISGHETERRASFEVSAIACPVCGEDAVRSPVNRVLFHLASPHGEKVTNYFEAASTAKDAYERTDDPAAKAATRPDIWRPAWTRARNKLHERHFFGVENDRFVDPNPGKSAREVQEIA